MSSKKCQFYLRSSVKKQSYTSRPSSYAFARTACLLSKRASQYGRLNCRASRRGRWCAQKHGVNLRQPSISFTLGTHHGPPNVYSSEWITCMDEQSSDQEWTPYKLLLPSPYLDAPSSKVSTLFMHAMLPRTNDRSYMIL